MLLLRQSPRQMIWYYFVDLEHNDLYTCIVTGIQSMLVGTLKNVAVVEGSSVNLTCVTNDTTSKILWFCRKTSESENPLICKGSTVLANYSDVHSIDITNSGEYTLILNSASMSTAGTYMCQDLKTHMYASAEVIVIGQWSLTCSEIMCRLHLFTVSMILKKF